MYLLIKAIGAPGRLGKIAGMSFQVGSVVGTIQIPFGESYLLAAEVANLNFHAAILEERVQVVGHVRSTAVVAEHWQKLGRAVVYFHTMSARMSSFITNT